MITIDEVKMWSAWANGKDVFKPHSVNKHSLAELALSQHEEIERLRADLREANGWINYFRDTLYETNIRLNDPRRHLKSGEPKKEDK